MDDPKKVDLAVLQVPPPIIPMQPLPRQRSRKCSEYVAIVFLFICISLAITLAFDYYQGVRITIYNDGYYRSNSLNSIYRPDEDENDFVVRLNQNPNQYVPDTAPEQIGIDAYVPHEFTTTTSWTAVDPAPSSDIVATTLPMFTTTPLPESSTVSPESANVPSELSKSSPTLPDKPLPATQATIKPLSVQAFDSTFFLPWYFREGERRPPPARRARKTGRRMARIFPTEDAFIDRITNQLMFVPPNYSAVEKSGAHKTILLYNGLDAWNIKNDGNAHFVEQECPVYTCEITTNRDDAEKADLVLFKDHFEPIAVNRSPNQVYGYYWRESPPYANLTEMHDNVFNWTATYRMDSTIVDPFKKWELYDRRTKQNNLSTNFATNKSKKVAWFVSDCKAHNNRLEYARELQKYIQVDVYGPCGDLKCPNNDFNECLKLFVADYKFYLAFENSNCRDYITDEFYTNLIDRTVVPIVMGAHPEDYENRAPYNSYIHVDHFATPKELADYLNVLNGNDQLYNQYFKWKGTGEFIDTKIMCRICALLHDKHYFTSGLKSSVKDLKAWWNGPGICTNTDWKENSDHHSVADDSCGILDALLGKF